jgi:hypothetical protein
LNMDEARELVGRTVGKSLGDAWHLDEFSEGWLVVREGVDEAMGASTLAVERETASVYSFPSSVPPRMIANRWTLAKSRGKVIPSEG